MLIGQVGRISFSFHRRNSLTISTDLSDFPNRLLEAVSVGRNEQITAIQMQVEEIHHEVRFNNGSSVKDAAVRTENKVEQLTVLVKRIARQASIADDTDIRMRFTVDADLNCTSINKSYLETFNLQESDIQNRNWMAGAIHDDDLPTVLRKWENCKIGTPSKYDNIQRLAIKNAGYIKCRVRATPVVDEFGVLSEFTGTVDILERL